MKSDEGPGVANFGSSIFMFYKGKTLHNIWLSTFNGLTWAKDVELALVTSIAPWTDRSPSAPSRGHGAVPVHDGCPEAGCIHSWLLCAHWKL